MMGSFLTRALVMVLGYAYPAYECYKTIELNKQEIEQLRFWCQYWILVALLTVFERVGDTFISWLPMYSEAKLAFFVYLWYPKTKGTTYVYDTFFRPYVAKHESEIDRNLLELRTRAGDIVVLYWQKSVSYGQTRFFEILQYVASQSQSQQLSRPRPVQQHRQQPLQNLQAPSAAPLLAHQIRASEPPAQPARALTSPAKAQQLQETTKPSSATSPPGSAIVPSAVEPIQSDFADAASNEEASSPLQETPMEEAIRITKGRLRKRAATAAHPAR